MTEKEALQIFVEWNKECSARGLPVMSIQTVTGKLLVQHLAKNMKVNTENVKKRKYLVVKMADNYSVQTVNNSESAFPLDVPIVTAHTIRLNQLYDEGYKLISVDNGVAYFELISPDAGPK